MDRVAAAWPVLHGLLGRGSSSQHGEPSRAPPGILLNSSMNRKGYCLKQVLTSIGGNECMITTVMRNMSCPHNLYHVFNPP